MKSKTLQLSFIIGIIIILPVVIFTLYELSSLKKNEKIVQKIYENQLNTILNSVNQYSDDVVRTWLSEINRYYFNDDLSKQQKAEEFLSINYQVKALIFSDGNQLLDSFYNKDNSAANKNGLDNIVITTLLDKAELISRLKKYLQAGYQKIEPVKLDSENPDKILFLSMLPNPSGDNVLCCLVVNNIKFIREILGPRIQTISQDKFLINVFDNEINKNVYSSEVHDTEVIENEFTKSLWLLPQYTLSIQLKGDTIKNLVRQRTQTNILVLVLMNIVLIVGIWLLYHNTKRELKLAQLKSDFVTNVSHEIRTPLSLINMYSETLEMDRIKSDAKRKEYYKIITQETKRLSGIVNKILNFSKIDSGSKSYNKQQSDINIIIEEILTTYKYHLVSEGFEYRFTAEKEVPKISIDREAVTDVILILIDNALKYTNNKKKLEIITGFSSKVVFIKIKDKGIGISKENQKLIFDKFYRVSEGQLAYNAKGTGLGLNIAKHIMDAHNGTISVESEPGKGSIFKLSFPVL